LHCSHINLEILESHIKLIMVWIRLSEIVQPLHELWHLCDILLDILKEAILRLFEGSSIDVVGTKGT
jgi:hypothetical protein